MGKNFFWKVMDGDLPMPRAALTLGARIVAIDKAAASVEVEFAATEAFTNPWGDIQGGFLAAMLDDTMGPALAASLADNEAAPTLELKTNFIAPAKVGRLTGIGRIVAKGKRVCVLEGELHQCGQLVAKATATALINKVNC